MENLLKTKRLEKRLTLEQVGEIVGVGKSTVRKWENGMIENMGRDKIVALSKALDISPLDILGIDKPQESTTKQILDNVFSKLETNRQDKVVSYAQSELEEQNKENLVQLFPYNVQEKLSAGTGYGYFKVPISNKTLELLKDYQRNFWEYNEYNRIIFGVSNAACNKTLKRLTGKNVHPHSLRHTYASFLILKGIDLISISKILGHENLNITLKVYAHQLEKLENKNFKMVNSIFDDL